MDALMVAGEPLDVLLRAFQEMKFRKTKTGAMRMSATLDPGLGEPLARAVMRVEQELLSQDLEQVGSGAPIRTAEQRPADSFVALGLRVADALAKARNDRPDLK